MDVSKQKNGAGESAASSLLAQKNIKNYSMALDNLQENALCYAAQGIPVFPCKTKAKTPLTSSGFKDASVDAGHITFWWHKWPQANIGLATGRAAAFWVLDIDGEEGETSLRELEKKHSELSFNVEVITGGGGRHIYFQWPGDGDISNSAGKLGPGLDVRGDGGYVIAPPSLHPCGKRYEWSVDSADQMRPAPVWLLDLLRKPAERLKSKTPEEWRTLIQGVSEGKRNDTLARIAGMLLRRGIDSYVSLELCLLWNAYRCDPPLPEDEVVRTVNSIAGRELSRRRAK
jgi:hypothetical protein